VTITEGHYRQKISDFINLFLGSDDLGLQSTYEDIDVSDISDARLYSGGDVFIDNLLPENAGSQIGNSGSFGFKTLVHEIGHALGLRHPGKYDSGGNLPPGPYLEAKYDNARYSVMSYNKAEWQGNVSPSTPMLYDIAAIQHLYGENANVRSGNTTYSWNPNTPFMMTIWDAGGTDTIDASNQLAFDTPTDITFANVPSYSTFASNSPDTVLTLNNYGVEIDLNPGSFSSIGSTTFGSYVRHATNNLAIAFGVTIENAIGSNFDDVITGNSVSNTLKGGAGNDIINPGLGSSDQVYGEAGNDLLILDYSVGDTGQGVTSSVYNYSNGASGSFSRYQANSNSTLDYVSFTGIERFQVTGSSQNDDLKGGTNNDLLIGGAGNDTLYGDQGNDTIDGGEGDDSVSVYWYDDTGKADNLDGGAGCNPIHKWRRSLEKR
jgi:serralysin